MKARNAMYAAVGAPIVAARALTARLENLREEMDSRGEGLSDRAQQLLEEWSDEGRQAVDKVSGGRVVDEIAARVDFDQAREQVGKLREQLEDMVATWRTSFPPDHDQAPSQPDPAARAARARAQRAAAPGADQWRPAAEEERPMEADEEESVSPWVPAPDGPTDPERREGDGPDTTPGVDGQDV